MPVAQWHYPFENEEKFREFFPADYICEAVDQTRGWFYTLHALSVLLFDRPCYRNVICLGHILDAQGEKMSKSKGNVVEPRLILNNQGADALRWYLLTSAPPGNVRRFSAELVNEALKGFLLTLWNVYSFFITYANIDKFDPRTAGEVSGGSDLDRWITSELNLVIDEVTKALEGYDPTAAGRRMEGFVDDLSNWYVRRSRRRFWKSENDADKLAAYVTLHNCLVTLCKLLAPFTPFVAEAIYQNLVRPVQPDAPESVHLAEFPVADLAKVDEPLAAATRMAMTISSLGRAARSSAGVKVRQPLAEAKILTRSAGEWEALKGLADQIKEELNVKEIVPFTPDDLDYLKKHIILSDGLTGRFTNVGGDLAISVDVITTGKLGYAVLLDPNVTPDLADEGAARELVHRLQTMRRSAGFEIADYIVTYYQGGPTIQRVMSKHGPYIKQETLSRNLVEGVPSDGVYTERLRIAGEEAVLGVRRED
jgi:isoleucyl-tRNA synthetase